MSMYRLVAIPCAVAAVVLAIIRSFNLSSHRGPDPLPLYGLLATLVTVVCLLLDKKAPSRALQRGGAYFLAGFTVVPVAGTVLALVNGAPVTAPSSAISAVVVGGGAWYVYRQSCR